MSLPFWDGCRERKLLIQQCSHCKKLRFYPSAGCPHCGATSYEWVQVSGKGTLYSWTRVERALDPAWSFAVPYIAAIVELDEQKNCLVPGLMTTNSLPTDKWPIHVEVQFQDVGDFVMPRWRLIS